MLCALKHSLSLFVFGLSVALSTSGQLSAQEAQIPRIGIISLGGPGPAYDALLRKGFEDLGYVEGKSIILEARFARGQFDRVPEFAAELVNLKVDVIAGTGLRGIAPVRELTKTIPIVFSASVDPAALRYVASLERPGGNITGISSFDPGQAAEQIRIVKQLSPTASRIAIISDAEIPMVDGHNPLEGSATEAARAANIELHWLRLKGPKPDIGAVIQSAIASRAEAVIVLELPLPLFHLKSIAEHAAAHRLPTLFPAGWPSDALIKYGTTILNATARIPHVVDKILKGAKPADLPVELVTERELVINLKTAAAIGVTIPPELLNRADRVIK